MQHGICCCNTNTVTATVKILVRARELLILRELFRYGMLRCCSYLRGQKVLFVSGTCNEFLEKGWGAQRNISAVRLLSFPVARPPPPPTQKNPISPPHCLSTVLKHGGSVASTVQMVSVLLKGVPPTLKHEEFVTTMVQIISVQGYGL